jgi:hypothetical protein
VDGFVFGELLKPESGRERDAFMTDKELIEGFESCSLTDFHHRDHVRVVWLYLHRKSQLSVLTHFAEALRRFAKSKGKPNL